MNKLSFSLTWLFFLPFSLFSQSTPGISYQKGYYRYPLDIAPRLNANFGEMRPNHFHMGLDLFTLRRENLPVYAAAEGYVSRVKIEPGGFGNAIYIDHPNGTTTLYAHMNDFYPALQQYVKQQQYKTESWAQELVIPKGLFPLKKGDVIGMSGNTGGSQGPHVHFEIRETATEKCLNPLLFGFNIPDNVPPDLIRLTLYNRDKSIYEQPPMVVNLVKTGTGRYTASVPRLSFSKVLIALQATDRMTGVDNSNGIFRTTLSENGKPMGGFRLDNIGYDETRYLNAHIDHKTKTSGGPYMQFLIPIPGDGLGIYQAAQPGGYLNLADTLGRNYRLEVADPYGNTSVLQFTLRRGEVNAAYGMANGVPNAPPAGNLMRPGEVNVYETEDLELFLPEKCLYDSIYFRYSKTASATPLAYSPVHAIHLPTIPVHENFTIRIRPDRSIPYTLRDRILIRRITRSGSGVKKAAWSMGKYSAQFRDFGTFQLIADSIPPLISGFPGSNLASATRISLSVKDDNGQVKNFRAELDGKWLRFVQRGNTFTYNFDEKCPRGEHELRVSVEDEAGNKTERIYSFTR